MRAPHLVCILVFAVSISKTEFHAIASLCRPLRKVWSRFVQKEYTPISSYQINIIGKGLTLVSALARRPFSFAVIGTDTQRIEGEVFLGLDESWNEERRNEIYPSSKIFDTASISTVFNSMYEGDKNARWLIQVEDPNSDFVGAAQIIHANLDGDITAERIVQTNSGLYNFYFIYDSLDIGWKLVDQELMCDNRGMSAIDFSLPGFFGLRNYFFGMGMLTNEITYYQLQADSVEACFKLTDLFGDLNLFNLGDTSLEVQTLASAYVVNSKTVHVTYDLSICARYSLIDYKELPFYHTRLEFNLVLNSANNYVWDRTANGLHEADWMIPGEPPCFTPEDYACAKLCQLKKSGTTQQKQILKPYWWFYGPPTPEL